MLPVTFSSLPRAIQSGPHIGGQCKDFRFPFCISDFCKGPRLVLVHCKKNNLGSFEGYGSEDHAKPDRHSRRQPKPLHHGHDRPCDAPDLCAEVPSTASNTDLGESGPASGGGHSITGHYQKLDVDAQQPELPSRRGRPPKCQKKSRTASASSENSGNDGSSSTSTEATTHRAQESVSIPPLPLRSVRRLRGRPRLASVAGSPLPVGASPSRDVELRTLLLRELQLLPSQLKPPTGSWRKLMASTTPAVLSGRVSELRDALGTEAVRCIAQRCPHALQLTTDRILSKLADLNVRLQLPRSDLIRIVCRFPAMMGTAPEAVGARVVLLVQELDKSEDFVRAMVLSQPVLLGLSTATLRHRIGLLHEAASALPSKWGLELSTAAPSTLGRLLRCSDTVLSRLTYTYLRTATNGRKFHRIRTMATICCQPAAKWIRENPPFLDWLAGGEEDRQAGILTPWPGWWRRTEKSVEDVDWWLGPTPSSCRRQQQQQHGDIET
ncbi:cleavage and polyadenylation factor 6-related protein [Volvox africanus]|uniref:Cleavage and polyadenylation factor 6-related protein n=1 Tax=Volvox africanus TaxID=51714 RepID=A0ABQ5RZ86_9CHLO|nr:cleavage and polyadenylation factor 6-related protein [Volvox africanus]